MSLLAAVLLAAAAGRIDSVYLTNTADQRLAVRVSMTGTPGMVAVHREGAAARVSIMDASLGGQFAGGRHFSWTPSDSFDPALLASTPAKLDRLELAATDSEVSVLLHVPPEVSVDVRRDARGLLLVFRTTAAQETQTARAAAPPPVPVAPAPAPAPVVSERKPEPAPATKVAAPPPAPAPAPPPVVPPVQKREPAPVVASTPTVSAPPVAPAPVAPAPVPSSAETADLARRLFPAAAGEGAAATGVAELYPNLFPSGAPVKQPEAEAEPAVDVPEPGPDEGALLGPFRVRASVDTRYVDADTFVEASSEPTRDHYVEIQPRVLAAAPVGSGVFTVEYSPVFRAFATYDQVNSSSHLVGAGLELPVGTSVTLHARDRFQSGVLDTRVVDPGGEYFFGLGHFNRNDVDGGASIVVGPRLSVELAGAMGKVHFTEPSSFYDYETRSASAGFGFELTPRLRAIAAYVYDSVPRPDEHPEAESTSHSGRLSLNGEILPLLTGELSVGYRSQEAPNAGTGGTSYDGFMMRAALTREIGRDASFSVYANRSTPLSAFEANAFYVSTGVQGVLRVPLVAKVEGRGGLGYQWNDYRTIAADIGVPREDRILGWFVGLRRPVARKLALSAFYRSEDRNSNCCTSTNPAKPNVDSFDTNANGFYFTLEWDIFGTTQR
jgi:Putative beta-barrel porin 2